MRACVIVLSATLLSACGLDTGGRGGGRTGARDAGSALDAGARDASVAPIDASITLDAARELDASTTFDAGSDAGSDAGTDAGFDAGVDAYVAPDAGCGARTYYRDADFDGYGDPATSMSACSAPPGYVTSNDDCAPADPASHPGAFEICDARDQNCDGVADESAVCPGCRVVISAGRPYLFCDVSRGYNGAEAVCVAFGYHLATIGDAMEDAWVSGTARGLRATGWWIGYQDRDRDDVYTWIAGTSTYRGWAPGEPSGGTEHCALAAWTGGTAGSWNDGDCAVPFPHVCEPSP